MDFSTTQHYTRFVKCKKCKYIFNQNVREGCFGSMVEPLFCPKCENADFEIEMNHTPIFRSDLK